MTLLEQLRNLRRQPQGPSYKSLSQLCDEAAAEIERLARENRRLQILLDRDEPYQNSYDPPPHR